METGQPGVTRRLAGIRPVVRGLQMNGNVFGIIGLDAVARHRTRAGRSNWELHRLISLTFLLMLSGMPSARAQVSASIKGTVTDPSNAPVPSAAVKTRNLETGAIRNSITDDAGRYLVLSLPVGEYEIRIAKAGFQEAIRSGIHLVVRAAGKADLRLNAEAVSYRL